MESTHNAACARRLIQAANVNGWSKPKLAHAIASHCGHSQLRAFRLAHGWTLDDVVGLIKQAVESTTDSTCHVNASRVSKWERGDENPGRRYLSALCQIFQSDPIALGLVAWVPPTQAPSRELKPPTATESVDSFPTMSRRAVMQGGLTAGMSVALPSSITEAVDRLRRDLDETLEASTISDSTVDHWQFIADSYGRTYQSTPTLAFLTNIAQDIGELRALTNQRLPTAQRRGLCHATTRMTGLLATTLINLNDHRQARAWFQTSLRAAEQSEEPALRAWILVRQAVSALY